MTKGRKTTWNERIKIVLDCLGNGKDYQKAAETYEVSINKYISGLKSMKMVETKHLKTNGEEIN